MEAHNAAEAVQHFFDLTTDAVRCVTDAPLKVTGYAPGKEPHLLTFPWTAPPQLQGPGRLALLVRHFYRVVERPDSSGLWIVRTTGYDYALRQQDEREVIAFHWHPNTRSTTATPHLPPSWAAW